MGLDWRQEEQLEDIANASKKGLNFQRDLLEAFNAQTKAIERQNELQEKMLIALEGITNNTAPKVKIVAKPENKKVLS